MSVPHPTQSAINPSGTTCLVSTAPFPNVQVTFMPGLLENSGERMDLPVQLPGAQCYAWSLGRVSGTEA
eukprot:366097-Chlamydomonas_euryale.AAC.26